MRYDDECILCRGIKENLAAYLHVNLTKFPFYDILETKCKQKGQSK